jgi:deoxyadenosine/deoxycytidine kinase
MSQIISVEGNIGSGKSTLLENLKQKYKDQENIIFLREPVDIWENITDENGVTMLQKFYSDQKKYSFPFQMMAYISRLSLLKEAIKSNPNAIIITERSLFTDKLVFAKMLYDIGNIEEVNYKIYSQWFDYFTYDYPINKIIYVNSAPNTCHARISERSRLGESVIQLEYLNNCDEYHNCMIKSFTEKNSHIKILELDGNTNLKLKENEHVLTGWLHNIDKFIYNK